jgi:hypothetical protein
MRHHWFPTLTFPFLLTGSSFAQADVGQHGQEFQGTVTQTVQVKYFLFIPEAYNENLGNDARFTILPDRDHSILDTYQNPELYSWFLQHSRAAK